VRTYPALVRQGLRRLLLASAGALYLLIALGLLAHAQEGREPVAVFDRSRGGLDPKGIDLGGLRLFPAASLAETYDDNIFAADDAEKADLITSVAAALRLESEWTRHELKVDARLRHQKFLDNEEQDRTEYIVRPELRLDLGLRDTARVTTEHSRRVIGRDDPEDTGQEEPTTYNRFAAGLEYTHRLNRLFFGAKGDFRRDDYISDGDDDLDRFEYRFGLPIGYEVSAKTDVTLEPFVRRRDFDERDSTGADRDSTAGGVTVGLDTELSPLFHLNFDIGFIANDFDDRRFDDDVDLIFGAEGIWYVTPLTTVKSRAERRDIATNQPGSSSKTQSTLALEVQHELRRDLLLSAGVRYLNDDFRDINRDDDRAVAELGAEFLLDRNVSVVADYRYEQRWSDASGQDYSRNLVTLGLRTRF